MADDYAQGNAFLRGLSVQNLMKFEELVRVLYVFWMYSTAEIRFRLLRNNGLG